MSSPGEFIYPLLSGEGGNCTKPEQRELGWDNVAIASSLVVINGLVSVLFGLGLEKTLIISAIRCLVQLTLMGQVLKPVFEREDPLFVFGLASLLMFISALEIVFNKTKQRHDWMFGTVLASTLTAVVLTSFVGNAFAIQANPWWRPRTYIPTLGMLLGNSMSGVAVGLNTVLAQATQSQDRIEMYLAFGASRWEAARPVCAEAIKTALLPPLNTMSVMGLISIPGMMTGQILGGASISEAVRYQQIIIFMICASCAIAVVMACMSCVFIIFDDHSRLRLDRIQKKPGGMTTWFRNLISRSRTSGQPERRPQANGDEHEALLRRENGDDGATPS